MRSIVSTTLPIHDAQQAFGNSVMLAHQRANWTRIGALGSEWHE